MKTIIAATDFSEEAENALEYAGALARETGAKVILFNSFSLPVHTANTLLPAEAISKLEEDNEILLQNRAGKLKEKYGIEVGIKAHFFLLIEDGLEQLFLKTEADLVVMGMAAKSVEQDIFGNTTTSAIMKMKYPVLAVPKTATYSKIDHILFACDELEKVAEKSRNKIRMLAQQLEAKVEVFHVEDHPDSSGNGPKVQEAREIFNFEDIEFSYKAKEAEDVIQAIKEEIKTMDSKLLIMIPQRYGFWESIIHRSKTRMMASGLSIPLLSIPQ